MALLGGTFLTAQLRVPFFTSTLEQRGVEFSFSDGRGGSVYIRALS